MAISTRRCLSVPVDRRAPQKQARYAALFCHNASRSVDNDMQRAAVEGGNTDYALARQRFNRQTANRVMSAWHQLERGDKQAARASPALCRERLAAQLAQ